MLTAGSGAHCLPERGRSTARPVGPVLRGAVRLMPDREVLMLYIHIGLHKTGSTFLQFCLDANRRRLARHGYVYPYIADDRYYRFQHVVLARAIAAGDIEFPAQIVRDGFAAAGNVILSAERLAPISARHENTLARWLDLCRQGGRGVKAIVYLRRQDLYAQSLYRHAVRAPETRLTLTFQDFLAQRRPRLDYWTMLQPWYRLVGPGNLVVRPYEPGQWQGNDLLADFLHAIGLADAKRLKVPRSPANRSYNARMVELLRLTNPSRDKAAQQRFLKLVETALPEDWVFETRGERSSYLSPEEQRSFMAAYEKTNALIASHWLGRADGILFREPLDEVDRRPDLSAGAIRALQDRLARSSIDVQLAHAG